MWVVLAFNAALLMSPMSVRFSVATYASGEAEALAIAAGLACGSLILLAVCWLKLPRLIRVLGVWVVLLSGYALWTVGGRCAW